MHNFTYNLNNYLINRGVCESSAIDVSRNIEIPDLEYCEFSKFLIGYVEFTVHWRGLETNKRYAFHTNHFHVINLIG